MKLSEIINSDKFAIHCRTLEEVNSLLKELLKIESISSRIKLSSEEYWNILGDEICFVFNKFNFFSEATCIKEGFTIISFSEIEFEIDENEFLDQIDWEQRRYEIAKEVLSKLVVRGDLPRDFDYNVQRSIEYADELIKQLKK